MYSNNHRRIGTLNYVYLFLALLGIFYFLLTFSIPLTKTTPEKAVLQQYSRGMLLCICIMEVLIGLYIKVSQQKTLLFLQSLATMLIITTHGFFVFSFLTINDSTLFSAQTAINAGLVLLIIAAILHMSSLLEEKIKSKEKAPEVGFEGDVDFGDY
jgi:cytochrome bd-type quinol oxidase subunit 2